MSAFTDEDLKRLKIIIKEPFNASFLYGISMADMDALFARLEAGELYIAYLEDRASHSWGQEGIKLSETWRKACGK